LVVGVETMAQRLVGGTVFPAVAWPGSENFGNPVTGNGWLY